MNWCVSPAGTCPLPGSSQFFLPCLWGMGNGSSSLTFTPAQKSPLPLFPYRRQRKGKVGGGQGSPSVLRLHRVFRLNQENFYYQKEKKEKKKTPSGHLSSLPHWDSQDWICGVPGRVAQGWNTLRQEWWSSLAGPPPGPLWASPLSPLLSPPSDPPEAAFPAPGPLGYRPLHWGRVGVLHSLGEGGRWDPGSLQPCPLLTFPRAGHFLP